MKSARVLLAVILVAACASKPAAPPPPPKPVPLDPVGSYEFTTLVQGQTVTGTIYITGTPGAYSGRVVTNMFPEIPIVSASVEENKIIIAKGTMPDGELTFRMVMDGQNFNGTWLLGTDSGEFNGKKLPKL
jgi:hypothetical protein